jgi:hypothetical protein
MPRVDSEALAASAQAASMEIDADLFDDQDLEPDLLTQEDD